MRCKYCEEYDIEGYEDFVPGELCPECREYTIPVVEDDE